MIGRYREKNALALFHHPSPSFTAVTLNDGKVKAPARIIQRITYCRPMGYTAE